ncbi:OmpA family protein [Brevundimonas lenta]|uniref:Outer membrane protein OmpA-like peptidoglycan-associated protein n=1 Tax=Brevundimonas lenta TaxID=424796 RepID=A0A7W6JBS7_9CAUL|nr:OmpA family protein [Brevundimonas lenta]MBB4082162.1 outer membrane protein OmpA-like peptidoglycan-associated protein [Brevundimonas lenta]
MKRLLAAIAMLMMVLTTSLAAGGDAQAQAGKLNGTITSNDGTTIIVRTGEGDMPVLLTPSTAIRGTSGMLGIRGEDHPPSDLIPGLIVEVTIVPGSDRLTAGEVTFKNDDLRTARQISAGLVGTDARVAENTERIDNFGQLVSAGRTQVYFDVGSAVLSNQGKADLDAIAAQAKGLNTAFRLAVVGRADPTGNAAANQRLSERRAAAVTDYLMHYAGITPDKFIPTAALGSAPVAQDPNPPQNNAEARRVTVTIAVSASARPQ